MLQNNIFISSNYKYNLLSHEVSYCRIFKHQQYFGGRSFIGHRKDVGCLISPSTPPQPLAPQTHTLLESHTNISLL